MEYCIHKADRSLTGEIILPASKSISNRILIIHALSPRPFRIDNLSESDDTKVLKRALTENERIIDIGHAGTSMRFLTAYLSIGEEEKVLTGSARMKERPVGELIDALRAIGADIRYLEKEGYPPLLIRGKKIPGGKLKVDSSISSQFISALLMIAPQLNRGLQLELTGHTVSAAYIHLTLKLMESFGICYDWSDNKIAIGRQNFNPRDIFIEADWTAASYWYEMTALAEDPDIIIRNLFSQSLQGDFVLTEICRNFGVSTEFLVKGIRLTGRTCSPERFNYHFTNHPDLVQTFAVLCGLMKIPFHFTGTGTLRLKETDRITALAEELVKFGIQIHAAEDGNSISYMGKSPPVHGKIRIKTYQDHRMAMAFAPAAMLGFRLFIDDPGVVSKSYPGFWDDLKRVGFQITN